MPIRSARRRPGAGTRLTLAVAGLALASTALVASPADAARSTGRVGSAVLDWNETASRAAVAACLAPFDNPLTESRMYAMTSLAVHDALNAIDRRATSYGPAFRARRSASPEAAVAAAAHDTLVSAIREIPEPVPQSCRDAGVASVETAYRRHLDRLPHSRSTRRGLAVGERAAAGVVALRTNDGSDIPLVVADFPTSDAPGRWRFTPGTSFAFAPGWGGVEPFALSSAGQFAGPGPSALTSRRYARDLAEVKAYGGDGVTTATRRSPEQTEIALYWLESSPTIWNRVARSLARSHRLDGWEQARMLGQLNAALADGYVATFAKKYHDLFWRPVTAIREADRDGNAATTSDPGWTPLLPTPPVPDHDSGHAVEGGAAAGALRTFFGTDALRFAVCSDSVPEGACGSPDPTLRHFRSVTAAARENAVSRVYVGFHFRRATEVGTRHGLAIGTWTATTLLRPLR